MTGKPEVTPQRQRLAPLRKGTPVLAIRETSLVLPGFWEAENFLWFLSELNSREFGRKGTDSLDLLGKLLTGEDFMAVLAVQCEPLSAGQIPVNREKYREFFHCSGASNRFSPVFMGLPAGFCPNLPNQNREFLMGQQGIDFPVIGSSNPRSRIRIYRWLG
jgi:hypothetical protein